MRQKTLIWIVDIIKVTLYCEDIYGFEIIFLFKTHCYKIRLVFSIIQVQKIKHNLQVAKNSNA